MSIGPEKDAVPDSEGRGGCRGAVQGGGNREGACVWVAIVESSRFKVRRGVPGTRHKLYVSLLTTLLNITPALVGLH